MRLYRFIDTDKKIDTVVVTDGSCDQKRVFITEIRGIVAPGDVSVTEDEVSGSDALLKLGFPWKVGESVMHEELVAFAENKALTLELNPQGLNEVVAVTAEMSGKPMEFTLEDLGLDAKEDLNVVIMANDNTWRKELTAENA